MIVIVESLCLEMVPLTWVIMWNRVFFEQWWLGQWRRKWVVVLISWPQECIGDTQCWKLCLNLWSPKWLSPSRNLVINFNPLVSWILQVDFGFDQINFNSSFLNTLIEEEFWIFSSRLSYSDITAGKKESLKKLLLMLKLGILLLWELLVV